MTFRVEAVAISERTGTAKRAVPEIRVVAGSGIAGDAHAGPGLRQVSFLAAEAVETMKHKGLKLAPGAFGENIVTRGLDWTQSRVGERIIIGTAEFEITQIGKECHTPCAIYYQTGDCIMPRQGIFTRVLKGGTIRAQDRGDYRIR